MDEPCSALDPIATLKIEDLMRDLARDYTIVIVTHNMQQAARVSDYTAFMLAGEERVGRPGGVRDDGHAVHDAVGQPHGGVHHRPLRLAARPVGGQAA